MKAALYLLAVSASLILAACGNGGSIATQEDDLTACLTEAGFSEPKSFVATVEIDGTNHVITVGFPAPHSEDDFLVVYEASNAAAAQKAAAGYAGGPSIDRVGNLLYAVAGANDPLTAKQAQAVRSCLKG